MHIGDCSGKSDWLLLHKWKLVGIVTRSGLNTLRVNVRNRGQIHTRHPFKPLCVWQYCALQIFLIFELPAAYFKIKKLFLPIAQHTAVIIFAPRWSHFFFYFTTDNISLYYLHWILLCQFSSINQLWYWAVVPSVAWLALLSDGLVWMDWLYWYSHTVKLLDGT